MTTRRVSLRDRRRTIHARLRRLDRKLRQMHRHRPDLPSEAWWDRRLAMLRRWAALWRVLECRLGARPHVRVWFDPPTPSDVWDASLRVQLGSPENVPCP